MPNYVFQWRGRPLYDIRRGLKKACKAAGIKYGRKVKGGFVFHDLRHTFVTEMRDAEVHDSVIMNITGHSTRTMFDRYNKIDRDDRTKASEKRSRYLSKSTVAHSVTQKQITKK